MATTSMRLCIFCRSLEPKDKPCSWIQGNQPASNSSSTPSRYSAPWTAHDEALLESLRRQPSAPCQRCADYDIASILENASPLDSFQLLKLAESGKPDALDDGFYRAKGHGSLSLNLGRISAFFLTPSCQLCRLMYRILPRPPPTHDYGMMHLDPFRWYIRHDRWEGIPEKDTSSFAPLVSFGYPQLSQVGGLSLHSDTARTQFGSMTGEAIALDSRHRTPSGNRPTYNARFIDSMIDFTIIREALDHCVHSHPSHCQPVFENELLTSRMIDVRARKVVSCPAQCDYLALSYVWGGIIPASDALENGTLPQTIEDAITITRKLGKQYLWVDALCIDQTPNPTPAQAAAKQQQLNIMHLIYSGAALTIYAVSGKDSKCGMLGVNRPRTPQTREVIDGHVLFTTPPEMKEEINSSVWQTRAWTFQENTLGQRRLYISDTHFQMQCGNSIGPGIISEAFDTAKDLRFTWSKYSTGKISLENPKDQTKIWETWGPGFFESIIEDYTSRKLTNAEDSLNACQGILNQLAKTVYPSGFCWGLPLKDFPQSLGWTHQARETPTRRPGLPSWTWAGYEGSVRFPPGLIDGAQKDDQQTEYDFLPQVQSLQGKELTLRGWVVTLDIRTEPFSEVVIPGGNETAGCVRERNSLHNTTLPSGKYRCLVVARVSQGVVQRTGIKNQQIFMITLKGNGRVVERETVITLSRIAIDGRDFEEWKPKKCEVTLI